MKKTLAVLLYLGSFTIAHAEDRFKGLICNTPEAIQSVFALHEDDPNKTPVEVVTMQNQINPDSCMVATVIVEDGKFVKTFTFQDTSLDIKEAAVKAVCQDGLCKYSEPVTMFIAYWPKEGDDI